jgi:hypothetical protein
MSNPANLYERDFMLWTEEQAAALRRAKESNLPLDWENLAEEIESLGRSDRRELASQITRIIRHLLKLAVSTATAPRAGWQESIDDARAAIGLVLDDSPSLQREIDEIIRKQTPAAAKRAAADLARHGEAADAVWTQLKEGGFTAEQVLGDWYPEPPNAASAEYTSSTVKGR